MMTVVSSKHMKEASLKGLLFGAILCGGFHLWFFELTAWGPKIGISLLWAVYTLYLASFYAGIAAVMFKYKTQVWTFPIIWICFEYLKSTLIVGNPACTIGYTLGFVPSLSQIADIGGIFLLSLFILVINTCLYIVIKSRPVYKTWPFIPIVILFAINFFYGFWQTHKQILPEQTINVAVIQPNHTQSNKLNKYRWNTIRQDIIGLVTKSLSQNDAHYIFLPETLTPGLNLKKDYFIDPLKDLANRHNVHILFGTPEKIDTRYYNALAYIGPQGLSPKRYQKRHLMPFGEYWPAKALFRSLGLKNLIPGSEFSPGKKLAPIYVQNANIAPNVCLESLYPWHTRKLCLLGANLIYTAVNNAWFFQSAAAQQHLQMSILRSIENDRYQIQAANTGLSAIIDNHGRLLQQSQLDQVRILHAEITLKNTKTVYHYIGEYWILLLILIGVYYRMKKVD
jgi:apolipoprotein N-acyltransferase